MYDVSHMLNQYQKQTPRMVTFIVLYCNLILYILYGAIYVLLHENLFPGTLTNTAISLAFIETVILFFTIITAHDKKSFMLRWSIFIILLNSSLVLISILYFMHENNYSVIKLDQYIYEMARNEIERFSGVFPPRLEEFLIKYAAPISESVLLITLIFKYSSAWAIYQHEFRRKVQKSVLDFFSYSKSHDTCQTILVSSA